VTWQVLHVNEKKRVFLDGAPVHNRVTRLAVLAALKKANASGFPVSGWIRRLDGTWEFDTQGPYKFIKVHPEKETTL
jgi:hypothetical protein